MKNNSAISYIFAAGLTLCNTSSFAASSIDIKQWQSFVSEMSMDLYFYQYCDMEKTKNAYGLLAMYVNTSNVSKKDIKKAKSQIKTNGVLADQAIKSGIKPVCGKLSNSIADDIERIKNDSQIPNFVQKRPLKESDFNL